MKKFRTPVLILLLALGACKKSGDTVSADVTTAEAADLVATTLSTNTNGFLASTGDIEANSQTVYSATVPGCGLTTNYSATHTNPSGSVNTYSNTFSYSYTLNCNTNNLPDNVTGTATDIGSFDSPRLSSTNNGNATFRVAGLTPTSLVYVINGEYKRTGTFTSKVESKSTSATTIDIVISNLTINKATKVVTSGTATITVTGTTTLKKAISFTGNLTFTGDGMATATLNGTVYIINLLTGDITAK